MGTFDLCEGQNKEGRKYTGSQGDAVDCDPAGCTKTKCCKLADEATCFPGESEVLLENGSAVSMSELESNTALLGQPVLGLLHLHSDADATSAHATATSV